MRRNKKLPSARTWWGILWSNDVYYTIRPVQVHMSPIWHQLHQRTFQSTDRREFTRTFVCVTCLDDAWIHGNNPVEHILNVIKFLKRHRERNIRLNPEKCVFKQDEIEFAGLLIDKNGFRMHQRISRTWNYYTNDMLQPAVLLWPRTCWKVRSTTLSITVSHFKWMTKNDAHWNPRKADCCVNDCFLLTRKTSQNVHWCSQLQRLWIRMTTAEPSVETHHVWQ